MNSSHGLEEIPGRLARNPGHRQSAAAWEHGTLVHPAVDPTALPRRAVSRLLGHIPWSVKGDGQQGQRWSSSMKRSHRCMMRFS